MSAPLEQFIRDHRVEFDSDEPAAKVWENIQFQLESGKKAAAPVIKMRFVKWSAAASIVLLLGAAAWYIMRSTPQPENRLAGTTNKASQALSPKTEQSTAIVPDSDRQTGQGLAKQSSTPPESGEKSRLAAVSEEDTYVSEEMNTYAKLVEIKHKELRKIEKDEPLLYSQFVGDVDRLDSVYHSLQSQLPQNPNREQLLEAMIQNLQLQMNLLNHQLNIIKQINHSKKSEYEKAYKSA